MTLENTPYRQVTCIKEPVVISSVYMWSRNAESDVWEFRKAQLNIFLLRTVSLCEVFGDSLFLWGGSLWSCSKYLQATPTNIHNLKPCSSIAGVLVGTTVNAMSFRLFGWFWLKVAFWETAAAPLCVQEEALTRTPLTSKFNHHKPKTKPKPNTKS